MLTESEHHINHKHVSPTYINLITRIIIIAIDDVKIEESMSLDVITTIIRESENKLKLVLSSWGATPGRILYISSTKCQLEAIFN